MATGQWTPRKRNYEREWKEAMLPSEPAHTHPLKAITVTESKIKVSGGRNLRSSRRGSADSGGSGGSSVSAVLDPLSALLEGKDPLSRLAEQTFTDPLSEMAAQAVLMPEKMAAQAVLKPEKVSNENNADEGVDDTFEPWSAKRMAILSKYTTSEKLSITTSFLGAEKEKVALKTQSSMSDKVKNRLEQLDDFEEGSVKEMLNLSQQDYVSRIDQLNNALVIAWEQDQRVKALKIAIQCAKLLADTSVIQFYPSKFVLVTDILDTFGRLVFERIKNKAVYYPKGSTIPIQLPEKFTPDQVPDSAKETCKNWFYKIASIRELIPRFYVETAILKCYSFLTSGEYSQALGRLCTMSRGIGDPLVGVYARCYLCRVGVIVGPSIKDHIMPCFDDFLQTYSQLQGDSVQNILAVQKLEMPAYMTLYSPALDWNLQCMAHMASESVLEETLQKFRRQCNSALLLNSIMSAFKPEYITARALEFTEMIKDCEETGFPKYMLHRSLGICVVMAEPPNDQKLNVLNEVWKSVIKLKNQADYISCAEIWIEYVVKHFKKREVNTILGDIIKHMTPDRAFEDFYPQLQSVVSKVLAHIHDFADLFSLDKFLPFIDMFQKESVKVDVCKNIMESFIKYQSEPTSDPVILNAVMFICKTMHDSVNALTLEDDIRVIGSLICGFIRNISFGRDFEQQLSFYVECRAAFSNIDTVLIHLVQSVNSLIMQTRNIVKKTHSRKTAAFVRACVAYTFITIPSLGGIFSRLHLYLMSGQVAMLNQCLSQGDAFFKAAISLLTEVPRTIEIDGKMRSTESLVVEFINNFLSTLLIVPDSPEQGVLYLVRGLLNVITTYTWEPQSDVQAVVFMNVLNLLSAMSQENYIYHVEKVDSNDTMYGSDPKFLAELNKICGTLVDEILNHLRILDKPETAKRQASLSLELFNRIVAHADLSNEPMFSLAINLWNLSQQHVKADTKQMMRTLDYVKRKATTKNGQPFTDMSSHMALQI